MLVLLACVSASFVGCGLFELDDDGKVKKKGEGWIKFDGKTYELIAAAVSGEVIAPPALDDSFADATGYTVNFSNKDMSNFYAFGLYSKAPTFQGAVGTYTEYGVSRPDHGTLSTIAYGLKLNGEELGTFGDGNVTIGYSDGKYLVDGTWHNENGSSMELYYEGEID